MSQNMQQRTLLDLVMYTYKCAGGLGRDALSDFWDEAYRRHIDGSSPLIVTSKL